MRPSRSVWLVVSGLIVVVVGVVYARRMVASRRVADAGATAAVLHVPRAVSAIKLDAETEEAAWTKPPGPARTGELLLENGKPARPHTEARLVWTEDDLYMAVLASDEDIRSSDFLHVVITRGGTDYAIDVYASGVVKTSVNGVRAAVDPDGVVDNPNGFDEEWNIEMAIPFASLGAKGERGTTLGLTLHRCDTPKNGALVCANLQRTLVLD